jgi:hypothetical protein
VRIAECDLIGVARYIIPVVWGKLGDEAWTPERFRDRILVVDPGLNPAHDLLVEDDSLVLPELGASGQQHRHSRDHPDL